MITEHYAARLCGFLYLFILATNAASVALGNKIGEDDSVAKLKMINDNPNQFQISIVVALISHVSIIALAGMLFIAFSPHGKLLAFVGTIFRLGEALILVYNEINFLGLLNGANEYEIAGEAEKTALSVSARTILQTKNSGFIIAMTLLSIGALAYCILFLSSGAIPTIIAWLGLAANVLALFGRALGFVAPSAETLFTIGFLLMMLFEIILGGWLIIYSRDVP